MCLRVCVCVCACVCVVWTSSWLRVACSSKICLSVYVSVYVLCVYVYVCGRVRADFRFVAGCLLQSDVCYGLCVRVCLLVYVYLSVCLSTCLSVCECVVLSVGLSVYRSVYGVAMISRLLKIISLFRRI